MRLAIVFIILPGLLTLFAAASSSPSPDELKKHVFIDDNLVPVIQENVPVEFLIPSSSALRSFAENECRNVFMAKSNKCVSEVVKSVGFDCVKQKMAEEVRQYSGKKPEDPGAGLLYGEYTSQSTYGRVYGPLFHCLQKTAARLPSGSMTEGEASRVEAEAKKIAVQAGTCPGQFLLQLTQCGENARRKVKVLEAKAQYPDGQCPVNKNGQVMTGLQAFDPKYTYNPAVKTITVTDEIKQTPEYRKCLENLRARQYGGNACDVVFSFYQKYLLTDPTPPSAEKDRKAYEKCLSENAEPHKSLCQELYRHKDYYPSVNNALDCCHYARTTCVSRQTALAMTEAKTTITQQELASIQAQAKQKCLAEWSCTVKTQVSKMESRLPDFTVEPVEVAVDFQGKAELEYTVSLKQELESQGFKGFTLAMDGSTTQTKVVYRITKKGDSLVPTPLLTLLTEAPAGVKSTITWNGGYYKDAEETTNLRIRPFTGAVTAKQQRTPVIAAGQYEIVPKLEFYDVNERKTVEKELPAETVVIKAKKNERDSCSAEQREAFKKLSVARAKCFAGFQAFDAQPLNVQLQNAFLDSSHDFLEMSVPFSVERTCWTNAPLTVEKCLAKASKSEQAQSRQRVTDAEKQLRETTAQTVLYAMLKTLEGEYGNLRTAYRDLALDGLDKFKQTYIQNPLRPIKNLETYYDALSGNFEAEIENKMLMQEKSDEYNRKWFAVASLRGALAKGASVEDAWKTKEYLSNEQRTAVKNLVENDLPTKAALRFYNSRKAHDYVSTDSVNEANAEMLYRLGYVLEMDGDYYLAVEKYGYASMYLGSYAELATASFDRLKPLVGPSYAGLVKEIVVDSADTLAIGYVTGQVFAKALPYAAKVPGVSKLLSKFSKTPQAVKQVEDALVQNAQAAKTLIQTEARQAATQATQTASSQTRQALGKIADTLKGKTPSLQSSNANPGVLFSRIQNALRSIPPSQRGGKLLESLSQEIGNMLRQGDIQGLAQEFSSAIVRNCRGC